MGDIGKTEKVEDIPLPQTIPDTVPDEWVEEETEKKKEKVAP